MKDIIERVLQWWVGELIGLLPKAWRPQRDQNVALWRPDRLELWRRSADGAVLLSSLDPAAQGDTPLLLRLVDIRVWRQSYTLPRSARPFLRQIFTQEMDRRTPWRAEQVYFHIAAQRDSADRDALAVVLSVLAKKTLMPALDQITAQGLRVDGLELTDSADPTLTGPTVALDGGVPLGGGISTRLRPVYALGLLAMLALVSLTGQTLWRGVLAVQMTGARQEAAATRALAADIAATCRRQNFPLLKQQESATSIATLDALSHALPDDTWAEEVDLAGGRIEVIGVSADAAHLLSLLENGDKNGVRFIGAEFRAPMTAAEGGGQKFHFAARVSAGPQDKTP